MVGRSNAGKSTLINALFGHKTARTSKSPGSTRGINIFQFEKAGAVRYLYDLPGLGHAQVSQAMRQQWDLLMDAYFRHLSTATTIVHIQDVRHPHQAADRELGRYLGPLNLPVILILNKLDKLKTQRERIALERDKGQLLQEYQQVKKIFYLSAKSGEGMGELLAWLEQTL